MGNFLSQYHWQFFATATFATPQTVEVARADVVAWLSALGSSAYAYVAFERGPAGGRTHCHALLGGLFRGAGNRAGLRTQTEVLSQVREAWMNGVIVAHPYDPSRGAAWYVSKFPADGEVFGVMRRHCPHRKNHCPRQNL